MVEKKYYCDICGKETRTQEYILPEIFEKTENIINEKNGVRIALDVMATKTYIGQVHKDVCDECANKIRMVIYDLQSPIVENCIVTKEQMEKMKSICNGDN